MHVSTCTSCGVCKVSRAVLEACGIRTAQVSGVWLCTAHTAMEGVPATAGWRQGWLCFCKGVPFSSVMDFVKSSRWGIGCVLYFVPVTAVSSADCNVSVPPVQHGNCLRHCGSLCVRHSCPCKLLSSSVLTHNACDLGLPAAHVPGSQHMWRRLFTAMAVLCCSDGLNNVAENNSQSSWCRVSSALDWPRGGCGVWLRLLRPPHPMSSI